MYFYFLWPWRDFFFLSLSLKVLQMPALLLSLFQIDVYQEIPPSPCWYPHTGDFPPFFRVFKISWVPSWQQNARQAKKSSQNNPWRNRDVQVIGLIFSITWVLAKIGSLGFLQVDNVEKAFSCKQLIVSKMKEWNTSATT